ncbi:MAG: adenylyltransferase/cytidyltransferase family protein [Verrucomicrobiota bacterium]
MKKVFVSGCYDILHAGHIQFFTEARELGEYLTVCFASDEVLWQHKERRSSIPQEHKQAVLQELRMVDEVVIGDGEEPGLDFKEHFLNIRPDILAVTDDDLYIEQKQALCDQIGCRYVRLAKTPPEFSPISTSGIVKWIKAPVEAPLRVDFAGGWLDVPQHAREDGRIVNCAITPMVSLRDWGYAQNSGLGGSGAWALLNGEDGVASELELGVGWQDPAIIRETGWCVWQSGSQPQLLFKRDPQILSGLMALLYTESDHDTPSNVDRERNYDLITAASKRAAAAVYESDVDQLGQSVAMSYQAQLDEGMDELPAAHGCIGRKYCGGGWGGYAVYLFQAESDRKAFVLEHATAMEIEPYSKPIT